MYTKFLDGLYYFLTIPILPIGKTVVTIWMLIYIGILLGILIMSARLVRDRAVYPALAKSTLDPGAQNAIGLAIHYTGVGIGCLIILNTAGIETTALTVVAGAVGLGLSLGLQTIAKNFVGGIILLFERPIRPGDRIQIAGVIGDVTKIALRSTTLRTAEQTEVVIPNGDFMNEKITNWTGRQAVVTVPIAAPVDLEPEMVLSILREVAATNSKVLAEPAPQVWLDSFSDKSLNYVLKTTTADLIASNGSLKSELNLEIYKRLRELSLRNVAEKEGGQTIKTGTTQPDSVMQPETKVDNIK